jgi:hydroxymethylbilane synthase
LEKILQIGLPENAWTAFLRDETGKALQTLSCSAVFLPMPAAQLHPALCRGDLDAVTHVLHLLPVFPDDEIANAAIISRQEPLSFLLIHPEAQEQKAFRLAQGARSSTPHLWQQVQMRDFRPDIQWMNWDGDLVKHIYDLQSRRIDALMLTAPEAAQVRAAFPEAISLPINPRECCPAPGLGAVVIQCSAADKTLRKQLQFVHNREIAELTNAERKLLRLLGGDPALPLGAFCERDSMGNVHLWAAWLPGTDRPLIRLRHSSSTTFEIAEQLFSMAQ